MGRDAKYRGTFGLSPQPVAGITLYQDRRVGEPSIEDMLEELEKFEIRDARKEELLAKVRERVANIGGTKKEGKVPSTNPKRYLVDPETGKIDVDEEEGDYTYKDALLVSASIKGKGGQIDDIITVLNVAKTLTQESVPKVTEKPKEYYVELETGIIVHDPENGEYTLSEARAVSQSMQKGTAENKPIRIKVIDADGAIREAPPGEPIVIKKETQTPGKTFIVKDTPDGIVAEEHDLGRPIIINQPAPTSNMPPMLPYPVIGADGQPVYDNDGKPVYANLEPMMKYMGFQADQRRADERHGALMGLAKAVRENLGDGISALKVAAEETRKGVGAKPSSQPQAYLCGDCQTQFGIPETEKEWTTVTCPSCGRVYTREEIFG